jgi:hypothetical protein
MDPNTYLAETRAFARAHLAECCAELIELNSTTILRDGRVRELGRLCAAHIGGERALTVAQAFIEAAALEFAASFVPGEGAAAAFDWVAFWARVDAGKASSLQAAAQVSQS